LTEQHLNVKFSNQFALRLDLHFLLRQLITKGDLTLEELVPSNTKRGSYMGMLPQRESAAAHLDEFFPFQPHMRAVFTVFANAILSGLTSLPYSLKGAGTRNVALEIEGWVMDQSGNPLEQSHRDAEVAQTSGLCGELGSGQFEADAHRVNILAPGGAGAFERSIRDGRRRIDRAANAHGASVCGHGSMPTLNLRDSQIITQNNPRYVTVPGLHDRFRRRGSCAILRRELGIRQCTSRVAAPFSSTQLNLDVGLGEAAARITCANRTAGYAVALAANSGYINGRHTGWADIRTFAWGRSHDIRTKRQAARGFALRAGLPSQECRSLADYFLDILDQPSFFNDPDNAFALGNGLIWRPVRLKFPRLGQSCARAVLEFRAIPLQPTAFGDYAMNMFVLGHIMANPLRRRIGLHKGVSYNFRSAQQHGLGGLLYIDHHKYGIRKVPARDALRYEIPFAMRGLHQLGIDYYAIREVEEECLRRVAEGNPADAFHAHVERTRWSSRLGRMRPLTRAILRDAMMSFNYPH